ncbi:glycoside hydrolase family 18 protein [Aggregicoccus sp. 17bor-14]|uniref:glycosyl hydrolase family 18 protein n=1 Tax=Myxococcaceae TaxID=31 RepID=UPI00129C1E6A|nr:MULTISPECIES: glycoside hydrolase family 18 protein [Myxococcaceae]MBF5043415.1 glycoside hydrolase family 18 protein [Simulacricoccus sp. 17bor-14]MRI89173.1 glycoside hydrolase family 18 protein [Aggregicoccus sp. 17bor-14]
MRALFAVLALGVAVGCGGASPVANPDPQDPGSQVDAGTPPPAGRWVTGYYVGWTIPGEPRHMAPADIDFGALTHVLHFAVQPGAGGALADPYNLAPEAPALVAAAHAKGVKVLLSVGYTFTSGGSPQYRDTLIANILKKVKAGGYDGVDIDWESGTDGAEFRDNYPPFIRALRAELDKLSPRPVLTTAVLYSPLAPTSQPQAVASVADLLDQVNLMTYYFMDAWDASLPTWHNSALYAAGYVMPGTSISPGTVDAAVAAYVAAGVPAAKLGVGVPFTGQRWQGGRRADAAGEGVTGPRQRWSQAPSTRSDVYLFELLAERSAHPAMTRVWDPDAQASYDSLDAAGADDDLFLSFDDAQAMKAKCDYVKAKGLGGAMLWQLNAGFLAGQPAGQRDPLLQLIKRELR